MELTHFDEHGNAVMVDVSEKKITSRTAVAKGEIYVSEDIMQALLKKEVKKGDVLEINTLEQLRDLDENSDQMN